MAIEIIHAAFTGSEGHILEIMSGPVKLLERRKGPYVLLTQEQADLLSHGRADYRVKDGVLIKVSGDAPHVTLGLRKLASMTQAAVSALPHNKGTRRTMYEAKAREAHNLAGDTPYLDAEAEATGECITVIAERVVSKWTEGVTAEAAIYAKEQVYQNRVRKCTNSHQVAKKLNTFNTGNP